MNVEQTEVGIHEPVVEDTDCEYPTSAMTIISAGPASRTSALGCCVFMLSDPASKATQDGRQQAGVEG